MTAPREEGEAQETAPHPDHEAEDGSFETGLDGPPQEPAEVPPVPEAEADESSHWPRSHSASAPPTCSACRPTTSTTSAGWSVTAS